jgi:hypothetical protein
MTAARVAGEVSQNRVKISHAIALNSAKHHEIRAGDRA